MVIADISDPRSVPAELEALVPDLPSVRFQVPIEAGPKVYGLSDHIFKYRHVLPRLEYQLDDLPALIEEIRTLVRER